MNRSGTIDPSSVLASISGPLSKYHLVQIVQKRVAELSLGAQMVQPMTEAQQTSRLDPCDVYIEIAVAEVHMAVKRCRGSHPKQWWSWMCFIQSQIPTSPKVAQHRPRWPLEFYRCLTIVNSVSHVIYEILFYWLGYNRQETTLQITD
jgi:hypothetical protein